LAGQVPPVAGKVLGTWLFLRLTVLQRRQRNSQKLFDLIGPSPTFAIK
jgi:hypothetical protein